MVNLFKKNGFFPPVERFYTREDIAAFDLIHFRESESAGDESAPALECPENWSPEAAALLAEEAICHSIPSRTKSVEENTVPSWLWRHSASGHGYTQETSVRQIFHRAAGAAAYAGWKKGVFANEGETRAFFDEACYMLAQRFIAIEPGILALSGLHWAYGIEKKSAKPSSATDNAGSQAVHEVRNASIDSILGGEESQVRRKWRKFLASGLKTGRLAIRFTDVAADWNTPASPAPQAALDLLSFRRENGSIDIDRLRHAVRLLVMLLDLPHEWHGVIAFGFQNLAPLLMSQAIPYDSDAGRATAAALAAIVTAEAYITSARLAARLGPSLDFAANRETILRTLRNRRRAAWGDRNDYEKVSVLPAPLMLNTGADLGLIAAARRGWDDALELVKQHGLRHAGTDLSPAPGLAFFMESAASGTAPMPALAVVRAAESGLFRRAIDPAVIEALIALGYGAKERQTIIAHIAGAETLVAAPGLGHATLRRLGFDREALEKIENYLPYVNDIRLAFTPWILGEHFYRDILKIPAGKRRDTRFDLLRHLGFSVAAIEAANAFCYGVGIASGAQALKPAHVGIFATVHQITAETRGRMAAAVQGFISGDAGLQITLPAGAGVETCERLLLGAWRQGIKSMIVECVEPEQGGTQPAGTAMRPRAPSKPAKRPAAEAPLSSYAAPLRSTLRGQSKAQNKLVSLRRPGVQKPARTEKT